MNQDVNRHSVIRILVYIMLSFPAALAILALLGFGMRIFFALPGYLGLVRQPPPELRTAVPAPGGVNFQVDKGGDYMIIADSLAPEGRNYRLDDYKVTLLDPDGERVPLIVGAQSVAWETDDLYGTLLFNFEAEKTGVYTLTIESDQPADSWTVLPNYGRANQRILFFFYFGLTALLIGSWRLRERWLDRHRRANARRKGEKFDKWIGQHTTQTI